MSNDSTDEVGNPILETVHQQQLDDMMIAAYFVINGAKLPDEIHELLVSFVNQEGRALTDEERAKIIAAVNKVKSLPTEDP